MAEPPPALARDGAVRLPHVLRAIRRHRGLRTADVARAMQMPLRTYQHFESGRGRLVPARVHRFAEAVNADPYAILLALEIGSIEFAVRCADNKLASILLMALQDFDATARDNLTRLDSMTLITAFTRFFDGLGASARDRDAIVEKWMSDKALGGAPADDTD